MMRRNLAGRRGMTLVELMVTLGILGVLMAGVSQTLIGFQRLYAKSTLRRQGSASARMGIASIERDLRNAGMAVDPGLAFDFTVYKGFAADTNPTDNNPEAPSHSFECSGTGSITSECLNLRDRMDRPDELVFYSRDPRYWGLDLDGPPEGRAWRVKAADPGSVVLEAHGGEYFGRGQILQIVCKKGANVTYARVSTGVRAGAPGDLTVNLEAAPGDPYAQTQGLATGCLKDNSRAFLVNRFRYHVRELEMLPGEFEPFLALDMGVDLNGDGQIDFKDLIPVAAGIVDMQVAYVRPNTAPTAFARVGATPGTQLFANKCFITGGLNWVITNEGVGVCDGSLRLVDFSAIGAGLYNSFDYTLAGGGFPSVRTPNNARKGADAANITEVEVHLVGRSLYQAHEGELTNPPAFLNRDPVVGSTTRYIYTTASTTVSVPNMASGARSYL